MWAILVLVAVQLLWAIRLVGIWASVGGGWIDFQRGDMPEWDARRAIRRGRLAIAVGVVLVLLPLASIWEPRRLSLDVRPPLWLLISLIVGETALIACLLQAWWTVTKVAGETGGMRRRQVHIRSRRGQRP